jgi:hypothetical protein
MDRVLKWLGAQAVNGALWIGWIASMALLYLGVIGVSALTPAGHIDDASGAAPYIFTPMNWANSTLSPTLMSLALALLIGLPTWIATITYDSERGSNPQAAILVTGILATGLFVVDLAVAYSLAEPLHNTSVCFNSAAGPCFSGLWGGLAAIFGFGRLPFVGAIIAGTPAWAMALIQTARWRQWNWFWRVLFLSPFAAATYVLFGPDKPSQMRPRPTTAIPAGDVWTPVSTRVETEAPARR